MSKPANTTDADQHANHDHNGDHPGGHADHDHHDHGHGGPGHVHAPASFGKAFAIGISLNVGLVVAEAVYGYLGNSTALLADAGHNLGDVLGLVAAWAGYRRQEKKLINAAVAAYRSFKRAKQG